MTKPTHPFCRTGGFRHVRGSAMTVTDERAEVLELLAEFNNDAKAIARRGACGTLSDRYAEIHAHIDDCLDALGL